MTSQTTPTNTANGEAARHNLRVNADILISFYPCAKRVNARSAEGNPPGNRRIWAARSATCFPGAAEGYRAKKSISSLPSHLSNS